LGTIERERKRSLRKGKGSSTQKYETLGREGKRKTDAVKGEDVEEKIDRKGEGGSGGGEEGRSGPLWSKGIQCGRGTGGMDKGWWNSWRGFKGAQA
jgi:hypothetical protein